MPYASFSIWIVYKTVYYKDHKLTEIDDSPFRRFITKCVGPIHNNLKITLLNRWLTRVKNSKKIIKGWEDGHRVIKIPKDKISKKCYKSAKNNCKYPCAWNKYIGRCTDIPKNIYRPDDRNNPIPADKRQIPLGL